MGNNLGKYELSRGQSQAGSSRVKTATLKSNRRHIGFWDCLPRLCTLGFGRIAPVPAINSANPRHSGKPRAPGPLSPATPPSLAAPTADPRFEWAHSSFVRSPVMMLGRAGSPGHSRPSNRCLPVRCRAAVASASSARLPRRHPIRLRRSLPVPSPLYRAMLCRLCDSPCVC